MSNEELVLAYQRGEVEFDDVFEQCKKLFYKDYNKYLRKFLSMKNVMLEKEDIYNLCLVGMYEAAKSFNPIIAKFSTYLALRIRESVCREFKCLTAKKRNYIGEMIYLDSLIDDNSGESQSQYYNLVQVNGFEDLEKRDFIEFCNEILEKTVQKQDVRATILNHLETGESLNSLCAKTRSHQTTISREFSKFKKRLKFEYMKMEMAK